MAKNQSNNSESTSINLGKSLRAKRKKLGLTMQCVADAAGLSVGFISQVERGITTPSLGSLTTLAKVLQTDTRDFLNPPELVQTDHLRSSETNFSDSTNIAYERLSTKFAGSTLHSVIINEPPGFRHEPTSHNGEELFFVVQGELTVELEGDKKILCEGESVHFNSQRVHSVWNHSTKNASIMWCGTTDIFAESASPIHKKRPDELVAEKP